MTTTVQPASDGAEVPRSEYYTDTAAIAATLERVARKLRAGGARNIARTYLSLDLQVVGNGDATDVQRRATVDLFGGKLAPGVTIGHGGFFHYRVDPEARAPRDGLGLAIYAPIESVRCMWLKGCKSVRVDDVDKLCPEHVAEVFPERANSIDGEVVTPELTA